MNVCRLLLVTASAALVVSACGTQSGDTQPEADPVAPGQHLVSCGGHQGFDPATMADGVDGVMSDAEVRDIFRQLLADPAWGAELKLSFLRDGADGTEFRVLAGDHDSVALGLGRWTDRGPARDAFIMSLVRQGDHWTMEGGGNCHLEPLLGSEDTMWVELTAPAGGLDRSRPDIEVGVTESACTGGRDPLPHLNPPEVVYEKHSVTVYWTSSLDAKPGEAFSCIGPPPTSTTLHLTEPLGDRTLLDGSAYPPRPVG